jgi:amidophosphoribosyltransferase
MHSCFYGIDTPSRGELLAADMSVEDMRRHIGVDSLAYVSIDGLYRAVSGVDRNDEAPQYCDACFSGEYPIALVDQDGGEAAMQLSLLAEPA